MKLKKIIIFLLMLFIFTGCTNELYNTPTKKVEIFFEKYQSLDQDVLDQLDTVATNKLSFTEEQKNRYILIMKRHYQALKYEIKDEKIDGDTATVTTKIEVIDYSKILNKTNKYLEENKEEFYNEDGKYDQTLFNDYRLEQLEKAEDTVEYTIDITLSKINGEWTIDDISDENENKIQGIYVY